MLFLPLFALVPGALASTTNTDDNSYANLSARIDRRPAILAPPTQEIPLGDSIELYEEYQENERQVAARAESLDVEQDPNPADGYPVEK